MIIEPNSKLVMIGDSITDCERARPVGEGLFDALGKGYVAQVNALLQVLDPARHIRIVNMGTSGNTVLDLEKRWQTDVLDLAPDWLSVMIGINDVWRQFDSPLQTEWAVPLADYTNKLSALIERTQPRLKGLILITPYFIEPNKTDPMRIRMDAYREAVRGLSQKYQTVLVDTQTAFDELLIHMHPMSLAWDRIHPNATGHMVLARTFIKAIGCQMP